MPFSVKKTISRPVWLGERNQSFQRDSQIKLSTQTQNVESVPRQNESPVVSEADIPSEILSISSILPKDENNTNLNYLKILESLERLKIEDVKHIVMRGLEENPSEVWSTLKKSTEDDISSAKSFVDDLNTFLISLNQLRQSLDLTESKNKFDDRFFEFLSGKVDESLSPPSSRPASVDRILEYPIDGLSSTEIFLLLINELRSRVSNFEYGYSKFSNDLIKELGQYRSYDPNNESYFPWKKIKEISSSNDASQLLLCAYALSNVFNLSSGIARLKKSQSQIGAGVSSVSDIDQFFEGAKLKSVKVQNLNIISPLNGSSKVVKKTNVTVGEKVYTKSIEPIDHALKIVRYDQANGTKVIPSEKKSTRSYSSGEKSLIRDAIESGDLNFLELNSYSSQLESSLSQLQKVTEGAIGLLNPENSLSPVAVFRRILEFFSDSLALADQSEINKYQLLALQAIHDGDELKKQYVLRCLGAIKYNRLKSSVRSGSSSQESSVTTTSVTTTKTSTGSEVITDDAEVKTVQSTTTSNQGGQLSISNRTIARAASDNSKIDEQAAAFAAWIIENKYRGGSVDNVALQRTVTQKYRESWDREGAIFSLMVDLYDDLTSKSKSFIPDGYTIVGSDGYTSYGKMDEYAILSLIVSCFSFICRKSLPDLTFQVSDGDIRFNFGGSVLSSASSILRSIISSVGDTQSDDEVSTDFNSIKKYVETYQNVYAILDSYSRNIKESKDLAVTSFTQVANDLNLSAGSDRLKVLSEITSHGIAVRRALLKKWEPIESAGYLPRLFSEVAPVSQYFSSLSSDSIPNSYRDNSLNNMRIVHVGVPIATVSESLTAAKNFLKITVSKVDYRYNVPNAFEEKNYIFDPSLFVSKVGSSHASQRTEYALFDNNGSSGAYSFASLFSKYFEENPGIDPEAILQIIKNAYNSSILEMYHYYTSGLILDESTSVDGDASISSSGLGAIASLASLNLPDVSLPNGASISQAFQDGYINFSETESGISSSKKEILSNLSSCYLFRSSRLLDRLTKRLEHDRVLLVPIDPDSFISKIPNLKPASYGLTPDDFETSSESSGEILLKNQNPENNGMSACSFSVSISEYKVEAGFVESLDQASTSDSLDINIYGNEDPSNRFNAAIDTSGLTPNQINPKNLTHDTGNNFDNVLSQITQAENIIASNQNQLITDVRVERLGENVNENMLNPVASDIQSVVRNVTRNITRNYATNSAASAVRNIKNKWRV